MTKKISILIIGLLLLVLNLFVVNAQEISHTYNVSQSVGMDFNEIDESVPDSNNGDGDTVQWASDGVGKARRFHINVSSCTKDIPAGQDIKNLSLSVKLASLFGLPKDAAIYEMLEPMQEKIDTWNNWGAGSGGLNMTDFTGDLNLLTSTSAAVDGNYFSWSLLPSYAQKVYDGTAGASGSIIISNPIAEADPPAETTNMRSDDDATSTNRPFCVTIYEPTPPPPAAREPFNITVTDQFDGSTINSFTAIVSNSTDTVIVTTTTGTAGFVNVTDGFFTVQINSTENGGYFNLTFNEINGSIDYAAKIYQAIFYINASEVITNNPIPNFNAVILDHTNTSNSSGFATLLVKAGNRTISFDATGFMTTSGDFTIKNSQEKFINITMGTANLTIDAFSFITGEIINIFNTSLNLLSTGFQEVKSTENGTVIYKTVTGTYNVTINATGFTGDSQTITITAADTMPNITFNLFTENSINITIFDEQLNKVINSTTTTIVFDHDLEIFTNDTTTGFMFIDKLFSGDWDIAASTQFHTLRHYFVTITDQSHTNLIMYLLNTSNGESKIFNIKNKEDQSIPGVTVTVSNKVNNTRVTVAQKVSDFAGQAVIFLRSDNLYRFTIEADGFETKVFDLEPVQSSYNIILTDEATIDFTTIYDKITYSLFPVSNAINSSPDLSFTIITSSPAGQISYFGLNSSFNNTVRLTNVTGSVSGGTATITINLENQTGATVPVDYFIKVSGEDLIIIHRNFIISGFVEAGNYSVQSFSEKYEDDFTDAMKAVIVVIVAIAIIISLAEVGAPAGVSGVAGVFIIIAGAVINWIPRPAAFIVAVVIFGSFLLRRGD